MRPEHFSIYSCADYQNTKVDNRPAKQYYSSSGFALIYEDFLYDQKVINKKFNNESLLVIHSILKKNTPIQLVNPVNQKTFETKVYKIADYPKLFNVVINKKIAGLLDLDLNNPFIEIIELKKNKKFIAKKSNIFDEEKNVAEKVPVNKVEVNDLSKSDTISMNELKKKNNYVLVVSDFYYEDSAINLMNELKKKINSSNFFVKKINDNKYRLSSGPYKNFNALKTTYISINNLGFENLNILMEW